jgi:hypothetical protein
MGTRIVPARMVQVRKNRKAVRKKERSCQERRVSESS